MQPFSESRIILLLACQLLLNAAELRIPISSIDLSAVTFTYLDKIQKPSALLIIHVVS